MSAGVLWAADDREAWHRIVAEPWVDRAATVLPGTTVAGVRWRLVTFCGRALDARASRVSDRPLGPLRCSRCGL